MIRHSGLPLVYWLNALVLRGPLLEELDAEAVIAIGDRWLADLGHRHVTIDDPEAAERLGPGLQDRGFERARTLFMAFAGDPARTPPDARVREVSDSELRALQLAGYEREYRGPGDSGLPEELADGQVAARAGTAARGFAAGEDGSLQSNCTLFLDPDCAGARVAMIEEVGTAADYRGRGLATAVVSAAVRAAAGWGADLIVVPADADDWPQLLYGKLGFEAIGRQVSFTVRAGAGRASVRSRLGGV